MNSVVNAVVGGWQVSTIISLHSGFPLAVYEATDTSRTNSRGPRPNCMRPEQVFGRKPSVAGSFQGYQWMSPDGYSEPATEHFGNCPLQGPQTVDPVTRIRIIGVSKNIHLTESKYFQFRGDFLNAFNNVQLGHPNTNFPSSTFGLINTSQPARNIQFAFKFYY